MDSLELDFASLEAYYIRHLRETILPFWQKNSYDSKYGGVFTCFSNNGSKLLSTNKYTWSQGRMVWILSRLSRMDIFPESERQTFLAQARHTLDFILSHCFLDSDMTCAFLTTREGEPLEQERGQGLAPSTFADCFVCLAMIAYMGATGDCFCLSTLEQLFHSILERYRTNRYQTSPYYLPDGARYHAIPMILLNVCNEYGDFLYASNRREQAKALYDMASDFCNTILGTFVLPDGTLLEMVNPSEDTKDRCLYSYVNPGHAMEDCWFMLSCAVREHDDRNIRKILSVVDRSFQLGWDDEYGGIRYYTHRDGGPPRGACADGAEEQAAAQFLRDCNNKLWWPNTEALYTALLAFSLSGDQKYRAMFERLHAYIFCTFPNPDREVGEWIQLRDREGQPFSEEVGGRLPVKDPYHITRDLILLIELTRALQGRESKL